MKNNIKYYWVTITLGVIIYTALLLYNQSQSIWYYKEYLKCEQIAIYYKYKKEYITENREETLTDAAYLFEDLDCATSLIPFYERENYKAREIPKCYNNSYAESVSSYNSTCFLIGYTSDSLLAHVVVFHNYKTVNGVIQTKIYKGYVYHKTIHHFGKRE